MKCGTSVGANYRAACRARSRADFVNKMGIVEEECDKSIYWMELIVAAHLIEDKKVADLLDEANQILSMVVGSIKTARTKKHGLRDIPIIKSAIRNRQSEIRN